MRTQGSGRATGHVFLKTSPKTGAASWYVKYRVFDPATGGMRQVQKRLGPAHAGKGRPAAGTWTKKAAADRLAEILTDANRGELDARFAPSSGKTFGEASAEWLRWLRDDRNRKPSTLSDYESVLRVHLHPAIGRDTPLVKIEQATIEQLRARLLAGKRPDRDGDRSRRASGSPVGWKRTCQKVLSLLRAILNRAVKKGWLPRHPMAEVEAVVIPRPIGFNVLTREQVEAVARAADTPMAAALIRVAAYTGLRWGELRALRWADVDFAQAAVTVSRSYDDRAGDDGTPKSGKARTIPLSDQAAAALDGLSKRGAWTGEGHHVFASDDGGVLPDYWGRARALMPALDAAGLGYLRERTPTRHPFRLHDLRHTFGSMCAAAGVDVVAIQTMMGHANLSTTMRYMHYAPRHDDAARLTRAFGGSAAPVPVAA
jgi:integrase